VSLNSRPDPR